MNFQSGLNVRKTNKQKFGTEFSSETDVQEVRKQNQEAEKNKVNKKSR
jgi:gamma type small acid-soluble spore protein